MSKEKSHEIRLEQPQPGMHRSTNYQRQWYCYRDLRPTETFTSHQVHVRISVLRVSTNSLQTCSDCSEKSFLTSLQGLFASFSLVLRFVMCRCFAVLYPSYVASFDLLLCHFCMNVKPLSCKRFNPCIL